MLFCSFLDFKGEEHLYRIYKKLLDRLETILSHLAILFLAVAFIVIFAQVIARYFFSTGKPWMEELCRYLIIWMTMFCSALGIRKVSHMRIDLLESSLKNRPTAKLILNFSYDLVQLVFFGVFIKYGYSYVVSTKTAITAGLGISKAWVYSAVPVGMTLMLLYTAEKIWAGIRELKETLGVASAEKRS